MRVVVRCPSISARSTTAAPAPSSPDTPTVNRSSPQAPLWTTSQGASFTFISDDTSIYPYGGSPDGGTFINAGTLSKTGGTGTSGIAAAFVGQGGTVDVQTGTIKLDGGSVSGTFSITQGTFSLNGTEALDDGLNVSGAGTLDLVGGTTTLSDTASLSNFAMSGGTLIVDGTATLPNFAQSGGTLTGAGTITVTGLTTWTGGSRRARGRPTPPAA